MADNFFKIHKGLNITPRSTDPLNPVDGDIQWSDGTVRPIGLWAYKNGAWSVAGGSGGGGLDTFYTQDFEAYGVGDFTSGLNAVYKTAGTFGGVLASETTNPISKDSSPKYTAGVTSTNDWFDVEVIDLDLKQRGVDIGITLWADMTNFSTDAEIVIWDITNSKKLDTTGLSVLKAGTERFRYSIDSVFIPSNTTQISWGFHMVTAPVNGESFIFDDMELSTDPFVYKDLIATQQIHMHTFSGNSTNNAAIPYMSTIDLNDGGNFLSVVNDSSDGIAFEALCDVSVIAILTLSQTAIANYGWSVNGTPAELDASILTLPNTKTYGIESVEAGAYASSPVNIYLKKGDILRPHGDTSGWNVVARAAIQLIAQATTEHVITPMKSKPNRFAARIDSTGTNTSEGASFLQPTSKAGTGVYDITYISGKLSEIPAVTATPESQTVIATVTNETSAGCRVTIEHNSTNANTDSDFVITLDTQGTDYQENFGLSATPIPKIAYIKDVKAAGTSGGTSTSLTVHTRDLNTLEGDSSFASINLNQITLRPGEYLLEAEVPAFRSNKHQAFVHDGTSYVKDGSSTVADNASNGFTVSKVYYRFSITSPTTYEIRHWIEDGVVDGLGFATNLASNPSSNEIYTQIKITKLR